MKNMTFTIVLIFASSLAFGQYWGQSPALTRLGQRTAQRSATGKKTAQNATTHPASRTPSALDQAIDQRVRAVQMAEARTPQHNTVTNPNDSREVYLNGQRFRLRKKERDPFNSDDDIHTYTNDTNNDTVQVYKRQNISYNDGTMEPRWMYQSDEYNQTHPHHNTSRESKKNADGSTDNITACEEENPDGSCRYVVKRTVARHSGKDGKLPATVVVIKRNFPAGTDPQVQDSIKRGTYQSLKNTNLQQTFGRNFKKQGRDDIYGPETYPN